MVPNPEQQSPRPSQTSTGNDQQKQVVTGIVVEALPNTQFRVKIDGQDDDTLVLAFLGGRMVHNRIRVVIGDRVTMEIDPYGGKARITRRG